MGRINTDSATRVNPSHPCSSVSYFRRGSGCYPGACTPNLVSPGVPSMISTSRSTLLGTVAALCGALMGVGALGQTEPARGRALELRMGVEQLRNPYWYEARGQRDEAGTFWDREHWERVLKGWADDGYNA